MELPIFRFSLLFGFGYARGVCRANNRPPATVGTQGRRDVAVTVRKWLTVAAVAAGLGLGATLPAAAADPKGEYTFGSLKAALPEVAKAQAEAWLKKAGKLDQVAFDKVWAQEEATVLDKTLATLELGSPEAKKVMDAARSATVEAPKAVPAVLKDD